MGPWLISIEHDHYLQNMITLYGPWSLSAERNHSLQNMVTLLLRKMTTLHYHQSLQSPRGCHALRIISSIVLCGTGAAATGCSARWEATLYWHWSWKYVFKALGSQPRSRPGETPLPVLLGTPRAWRWSSCWDGMKVMHTTINGYQYNLRLEKNYTVDVCVWKQR